MKNTIRRLGIHIPRDADLVERKIDEALSGNGCTAAEFFFTAEKIATCKKRDRTEVQVKATLRKSVRISVHLDGNQCVIGILSPTSGRNLMTPEQIARNISGDPVDKIQKDTTLPTIENSQTEQVSEKVGEENEEKAENTPYSIEEIRDDTFIGLFYLFLKEFFEKKSSQVETSASICNGFNLSSACEKNRCLTTIRTARILVELSKQNKVAIVQVKPHGLYSLASQETSVSTTPVSTTPVQTSEPQTPKVSDNNINIGLLTNLLDRKNDLRADLADQEAAIVKTKADLADQEATIVKTREGLKQVDSEIRSIPNIRALYNTLAETLG